MYKIGRIKQVQVQQSSLKVGSPEYYDPTPLLVVDHILVSTSGTVGVTADDRHIIDVHNANHPGSRNRGDNSLSLGFTSHYASMRSRFGLHLVDGCAGENILIETDKMYSFGELKHGLAVQKASTDEIIYLTNIEIAAPCVPFSQYAAKEQMPLSNEQTKEVLQFLHYGRRGFYAELADAQQEVSVQAGDILLCT